MFHCVDTTIARKKGLVKSPAKLVCPKVRQLPAVALRVTARPDKIETHPTKFATSGGHLSAKGHALLDPAASFPQNRLGYWLCLSTSLGPV